MKDFEIIIVDNNSTDKSVDGLQETYPNLNLHVEYLLLSNRGFAPANNIAARLAKGKWLALLNADAFPEPDWLEKMMQAAESNPDFACFASRQIQVSAPELLDGAGDAYHISGLGWRRYYNKLAANYGLRREEVFSPCGAAALYLRDDFLQAGGFDEDYFSYFEDVDLGFRLRLSGKKCLYVPEAVVHHVGSASTGKRSDFSVYYGHRNLVWTYFKDMPSLLFWLYLPLHLLTNVFFLIYFTLKGQGSTIWRAKRDALLGLPKTLKKRRAIQSQRQASIAEIHRVMSHNWFTPFLAFIKRKGE